MEGIETIDVLNVDIGEDKPQIIPKSVKVISVKVETVSDKTGKKIGDKLIITVQHPDRMATPLDISSVEYMQDKRVKPSGLWLNLDANNKLPYKSAVANLLRFYKVPNVNSLVGIYVQTILDERGYLTIKAY